MSSRSYTRILWKEYRAQRMLWLALLLGAAVLQILYLCFSPQLQNEVKAYPFYVSAVLSVCYAMASASMLFAGEREEETDRLLQALGARAADIMAGKLVYSFLSLAAFCAIVFASAGVVLAINQGTLHVPSVVDSNDLIFTYLSSIPLGFTTALLASLMSRRVLGALLGGIGILLLITGTAHSLMQSGQTISDFLCAIVLLSLSLSLVPRWLNGSLDWSALTRIANFSRLRPRGGKWLHHFLIWASLRTSSQTRLLGVICWKEIRLALPVLLLGVLLNFGFVLGLIFGRSAFGNVVGTWIGLSWMAIWALISGLGVMTSAGDNRRQLYRFYSEHGASPGLVWLAKQCVWLSVLILLGAAFVLSLSVVDAIPDQYPPPNRWSKLVQISPSEVILYLLLWQLTCFFVVQLISMWFPKLLLAISFSFVACCLLQWAGWFSAYMEVPGWCSIIPVLIGAVAASYFTFEGWMNDIRSWKHLGAQIAWAALPATVGIAGTAIWRATEVPLVDPGFNWQAHEQQMDRSDPEWARQWTDFSYEARRLRVRKMEGAESSDQEFERSLNQIITRLEGGNAPSLDMKTRIDAMIHVTLMDALTSLTAVEPAEGPGPKPSMEKQWQRLRGTLLISNYLASQSLALNTYLWSSYRINTVYQQLMKWGQSPDQTAEQLDQLIALLNSQPVRPSPRIPLENNYVTMRQALERRSWGKEWAEKSEPTLSMLLEKFPFSLFSMERTRALRLLNWRAHMLLGNHGQRPDDRQLAQYLKWESTCLWMPDSYENSEARYEDQFQSCLRLNWATRTIALLEKYRLEHGHYPERLEMVFPSDAPDWTGIRPGEYRYEPAGMDRILAVSSNYVLPVGQPVLFRAVDLTTSIRTVFSGWDIADLSNKPELAPARELFDQNKVLFLKETGHASWIYHGMYGSNPRILQTLLDVPEKTDRIRFIQFGEPNPFSKGD